MRLLPASLLVHFHPNRILNTEPADIEEHGEIEWVLRQPKVLDRATLGDTETLDWIVRHVDEIECITECELIKDVGVVLNGQTRTEMLEGDE